MIVHPDPLGQVLKAVREFGSSLPKGELLRLGVFWDYASVPQRGRGGVERTAEEHATFERALDCMGAMFASMTSTTIIQLRERERMHCNRSRDRGASAAPMADARARPLGRGRR